MRTNLFRAACIVLLVLSGACATLAPDRDPTSALLSSLQATTVGDSVHFLLQITNPGPTPVKLEFSTDPAAYFTVARGDVRLWHSAPNIRRTEEPISLEIGPGATHSFEASWNVPLGLRGTMTATGVLRDVRKAVVQSTGFPLP